MDMASAGVKALGRVCTTRRSNSFAKGSSPQPNSNNAKSNAIVFVGSTERDFRSNATTRRHRA
jgi:hypothetical protein